jgi:hypothetical protein
MDAARLRELLGAGDAEQRASALAELEQSRVDTALAVECLPALAELLRKPVAEVDAQETQRIGLVLGNLCGMAAATLGAWLNEGYYAAFSSPHRVFGAQPCCSGGGLTFRRGGGGLLSSRKFCPRKVAP